MSGVEALARALCRRVSEPGYCDRCEGAAEHVLADPGPLLEALAEAGVLREQRGSIKPMVRGGWAHVGSGSHTTEGRRYATEWEPTDARA